METLTAILEIPAQGLVGAIGILDSLPDYIRAMLAAFVLAMFLRYFESRIPRHEVQYGQSFRKTALVALVFIPALVYLFPASRMVVFVEELAQSAPTDHWVWRTVLFVWFCGCILSFVQLCRAQVSSSQEVAALPVVEDEKLLARLAHWQRRLGMPRQVILVGFSGDRPRQFMTRDRIGLPSAAMHWPGSVRDVVLIHSLCHIKQRHAPWHLAAQGVAALYWPITWLQSLHSHLLDDFQRSTDELADSCYQDHLGYGRALGQLEQRLEVPDGKKTEDSTARDPGSMPMRYFRRLQRLLSPASEPAWNLEAVLAERKDENVSLWTDPYDKVVLFVGQAIFLAFLLTGVTLEQKPPDMEKNYSLPFAVLWKEHFHRNLELQEKTGR